MSINSISIILFLIVLFSIIFKHRKKFSFEKIGFIPIIAILRTKFGINFINSVAKKHPTAIKRLAFVGVFIGFVGMILMTVMVVYSFINLFLHPNAPASVSLVIPGVKLPGQQMFFPFWYTILALFVVVLIHEFGHGIVAKSYKLPIKNTGFLLFLFLPGAFVEPDEAKLQKSKLKIKTSVFAAGPWFNALLSILMIILMLGIGLAINNVAEQEGIYFTQVEANSSAYEVGLPVNTTFVAINNYSVKNINEFLIALQKINLTIGSNLNMTTDSNKTYSLIIKPDPNDGKPKIGISNIKTEYRFNSIINKVLFNILRIIHEYFFWIMFLSLGIGSANLLPIGPFDGGRMLYAVLESKFGSTRSKKIIAKISSIIIIMLLILIVYPIIRAI